MELKGRILGLRKIAATMPESPKIIGEFKHPVLGGANQRPTKTEILEAIYPVGAVYISAVSVNPGELFGFGVWERIKDRFLLAAGEKYEAGTTGGESSHVMTVEEMPEHFHVQLGTKGFGENSSPVRQAFQSDGNVVVYDSNNTPIWYTGTFSTAESKFRTTDINVDGETGKTGGNKPMKLIPPYFTVCVWWRVE